MNITITCFFILNDQFKEMKMIRSGFWRMLSVPFTCIYLVECATVMFQSDAGTILREKKLYLLELFCLAFAIWGYVLMFSEGSNKDYATGASYVSFSFLILINTFSLVKHTHMTAQIRSHFLFTRA